MNPDQQDFETLRKLMALKRHEQPPAEYHSRLHDTILTRIEGGEGETTFWERFSANLTLRPGLVYAFGLTMCGALGLSSLYMSNEEATRTAETAHGLIQRPPAAAPVYASETAPANTALTLHVANWLRNTNPTVDTQPQLSLFDTPLVAMPVAYQTSH